MKGTRSTLINSIATTLAALMLLACGSGGGGSTGTASLSLTDAPVDSAQEVVVYIDGVEFQPAGADRVMFNFADTTGSCEVVDVHNPALPCKINLMAYTGSDKVTLLDDVILPAGQYSSVRLILNDDPGHIILLDGKQFNLRVPSDAQSGLILNSGFLVTAGNHTDSTIDFDLRKSVHNPAGSSDYILRPALRIIDNSEVGALSGTIDPSFYTGGVCNGAVYVFDEGTPGAPDDEDGADGGPDPITTGLVPNDGPYEYTIGFLTEGDYLIAFTCDALADDPVVDNDAETVGFLSAATVTISAGSNTVHNFPLAPPQDSCTDDQQCSDGFSCWYEIPRGPSAGIRGSIDQPGLCWDNAITIALIKGSENLVQRGLRNGPPDYNESPSFSLE